MFVLPGFQGGLLGQVQRLDRGRRPAVLDLEPGRQDAAVDVDRGPPPRPQLGEAWVDAGDLADRPLPHLGVRRGW